MYCIFEYVFGGFLERLQNVRKGGKYIRFVGSHVNRTRYVLRADKYRSDQKLRNDIVLVRSGDD